MEEAWQKYGYPSPLRFYKLLKKTDPEITFAEVDKFVRENRTYQLHKKTRRQIQGHIVAYCKDCLWFADLLDMSNYSRQNKGYKWILLCIDTFTRKAYAQPLKRKTKDSVKEGFEAIMDGLDKVDVKILVTDSGNEFLNKPVQELLKKFKVEHRTVEVGDHNALGIIDRLSRTVKEMIFKDFTERNSVVWYDRLQNYVDAYNSSPHRGIMNLTPNEAGDHKLELVSLNLEKSIPAESPFKVGEMVRKRLKRPTFKKGYKQQWGERVHKIEKVNVTGVKALLDNGETVRLDNLQLVFDRKDDVGETSAVEEADKSHKVEKIIKHKEGLDPKNILSEQLRKR